MASVSVKRCVDVSVKRCVDKIFTTIYPNLMQTANTKDGPSHFANLLSAMYHEICQD